MQVQRRRSSGLLPTAIQSLVVFDDNGTIRKALSSFRLKTGDRPAGNDTAQGTYDGIYGPYITDQYPYVLSCFKGTVDNSFNE